MASHYDSHVPELQRLRADHAPAVLTFELENRSYFTASVSDRGDEFFLHFTEHFNALLDEQERGGAIFHVLLDDEGTVLGRFNLLELNDGTAVLGYRVAQHAAGRGVATAAVLELCRLAATHNGMRVLRAATSHDNVASQKVLAKTGFFATGSAEPGGRPGTWYQRILVRDWRGAPGHRAAALRAAQSHRLRRCLER